MAEVGNQVQVELLGNRYQATVAKEPVVEIDSVRRKNAIKVKE